MDKLYVFDKKILFLRYKFENFIMKLKKLEDSKTAWNYIFIFNAGISLVAGKFLFSPWLRMFLNSVMISF